MLVPVSTNAFERDLKLFKKRGKDLEKVRSVIRLICENAPLPAKLKDHFLVGIHKGYRECHVEPDWLLIYKIKDSHLYLARTGSHSDLFD